MQWCRAERSPQCPMATDAKPLLPHAPCFPVYPGVDDASGLSGQTDVNLYTEQQAGVSRHGPAHVKTVAAQAGVAAKLVHLDNTGLSDALIGVSGRIGCDLISVANDASGKPNWIRARSQRAIVLAASSVSVILVG